MRSKGSLGLHASTTTFLEKNLRSVWDMVRAAVGEAIILHYMDDVLVCAPNDDLLSHALDLTIDSLVAAGFELQEEKIQRMPPWKYLGLEVVLQQPRCPPLDTLKHLNVLPKLRGPKLDTALTVWPHQCRVQGKNDLPAPSGHTIPDPGQDAIGPLGHLGTLLAHVQLLAPVPPGPFPPGHCPASHTFPSL
ncbi:hypothetical protein DUI87_04850 [Hirundo rustica rustica]|uniref:ribonuclease H n=1 Tax=Hirundo rustica rustica TaxID=333673 RepID=A0A3M0KYW1_HIRRU|nr:hypothetical protein DUI87_04850 [Hirundo rustica rustica]